MKKTILLIDDNLELATSYQELLCDEGFDALVVGSGQEALALLAGSNSTPNLLLVDCEMPRMSGEQFIRALKEKLPSVFDATSIVGFSSHIEGSKTTAEMLRLIGRVYEKPDDVDRFLTLVRDLLGPVEGERVLA